MTTSTLQDKLKKVFQKGAVIVFWLLLWYIIALLVGQEILLPTPFAVLKRLVGLVTLSSFWKTVFFSIGRVMAGYLFAILCGAGLALLTSFSKFAKALFQPLLHVVRATPIASFIILALVWLSKGRVASFAAGLMVFPIIWSNVSTGIETTPKPLLEMANVFNLSRTSRIKNIYFPHTYPYFMSGCITALGFAWKAGVAAEVISVPAHSIGLMLYDSKIYLETPDLFAWTIVIIVLSLLLEKLVVALANAVTKKFFYFSPEKAVGA